MNELHIGSPNQECACCRRVFDDTVKPTGMVRVTNDVLLMVNFYVGYRLCADCVREMKSDGERAKTAAKKINSYHMGDEQ